jgi:hypothetical protein
MRVRYPEEDTHGCTSLLDPVDIANNGRTYRHFASASKGLKQWHRWEARLTPGLAFELLAALRAVPLQMLNKGTDREVGSIAV